MKNKLHYRIKIKDYLEKHNLTIVEDSPITKSEHLVFELENNLVLKVTDNIFEIIAADKLSNIEHPKIATIISIHERNDFTIILMNKLSPLNDNDRLSYKNFHKAFRRYVIISNIIFYLSLGAINIQLDQVRWLFSDNTIKWLDEAKEIKNVAISFGIEHPSDFLSIDNLGFKDGKLACFDMQDIPDKIFYQKI